MKFKGLRSSVSGLDNRLFEDELYRMVWDEIESDKLDPVAKLRALEDGGESETKMRSAYVRHRIQSLKDQLEAQKLQSDALQADAENKKRDVEAETRLRKKEADRKKRGDFVAGVLLFIFAGFFSFLIVGGVFLFLMSMGATGWVSGLLILSFFSWLILWGFLIWKLPLTNPDTK